MDASIKAMLDSYNPRSLQERKNAVKEVMQEIVLCGLSRAGFFDHAAFYGGTALRIFYGLDRFSEDMDFSLIVPNPDFALEDYFPTLKREVNSFGLNVAIEERHKSSLSDIHSAFLKANTREHLLFFYPDEVLEIGIPKDEKIRIKFEVDVNPPADASFERRYRLLPTPYEVNLYDASSLFAGKIHAVLCRGWKNRVKGRDLYDYLFYLSRGISVNLSHLCERLKQTGGLHAGEGIDLGQLKKLLCDRFDSIDFNLARKDVEPFIADTASLSIWSADLFKQATEGLEEYGMMAQ